jgi:hypothetical protein
MQYRIHKNESSTLTIKREDGLIAMRTKKLQMVVDYLTEKLRLDKNFRLTKIRGKNETDK